MMLPTMQRIVLAQAGDPAVVRAAVRWAHALPGVEAVGFQRESGELVVHYDLWRTTLADLRRHLLRAGIALDASLLQRCHLMMVHAAETTQRRDAGVPALLPPVEPPLVPVRRAA